MDKDKYFLVNRGSLEKRLDPFYYIPSIVALEKTILEKGGKPLRRFIKKMGSGATPKVDEEEKFYSSKENGGKPFIRVQNLSETSELMQDDLKYINEFTHNIYLKRSQVKGGDLLTKITGVGRMAVTAVAPTDFEGNINQHIVVCKTASSEESETLAAFLNSDIGEKLATRRATGGTRPALDYPALRSIPIVFKPEIVPILKDGVKRKREKEEEAKSLLGSIDNFILEKLEVELPPQPISTIENRMNKSRWGKLIGNRWDPFYYQSYFDSWLNAFKQKQRCEPLKNVTELICIGKTPSKDAYSEQGSLIVKAGSLKESKVNWDNVSYTDSKTLSRKLKDGDILLLSAAHQITYIGKNPCIVEIPNSLKEINLHFVGELLCIRTNPTELNPYYLLALLNMNCFYFMVNRETRGQTSHLYPNDMQHLQVPVPNKGLQDEIGNEFKRRLDTIRKLKDEAAEIFSQTKKEIEKQILA